MAILLATTQAPGGAKPQFPPFNSETFASQVFWFAITFVLLYLLMSRVALPRVGAIVSARADRIAGDLADAQKTKDETDAAIAGYEKKLADARANAQSIAAQTRDKLMAEADDRRKSVEAKLTERLHDAEKTIAQTKTAAMANVKSIATDAASAIVERLIGNKPDAGAVNDAVEKSLKG
ncbi:F0F1 ATP synthase subunit B [Pseudorhodoplanes sp.]|uniref:F0F1 ATP synthase subunit B n=1 Tax=Pseudorhodoplanes sp. TaxID=1934341 RepID=UPI002BB6A8AB|nr:F0F1 ATP synthase subunit B [Pseudorhodoplanes sp.]HWV52634.1 F0F1 ATP synthase subunit B [Pseudorhodoplanes sp.]